MMSINPSSTQHRLSNDLVQINTNLRYELDHSIEIATLLNNENQLLKQSYEQLKAEQAELKQQLDDAKQVAETTLQIKHNIEQECESLYTQWKQQVEALTANFGAFQQNSVSKNELNVQSVILSEKYENIYKIKFDELNQQINKYHQQSQASQSQVIQLTNAAEQQKQLYAHDMAVMQQAHKVELEQLLEKNAKLQSLLQQDTHSDSIRGLERNNSELIVLVSQNKSEKERLLEQIDSLQQQLHTVQIEHETAINKYKTDYIQQKSDNTALQQLADKYKSELTTVQHENSEMSERNIQLLNESQLTQSKLQQATQLHTTELHQLQSQHKKLQSELGELKQSHADEKSGLDSKHEAEKKVLQQHEAGLKAQLDRLNDKIKSAELTHTTSELQLKNDISQLKHQCITHEQTISTLNGLIERLKVDKAEHERHNTTSLKRSDSVQQQLTDKQTEITALHKKYEVEMRHLNELIDGNKHERTILLQRIKNFEDNANVPDNGAAVMTNAAELERLKADKLKYKRLCVTLQKKLETVLQDFATFQSRHSNCTASETG